MGGEENNSSPANWASKKIFTTGEAAEVCKVSQQTIIRCFDSGRLTGFRVPGSKFRRIPREELIRFMRENEIPTSALESGRTRVLIVEDDPEIIDILTEVLDRDGRFEVRAANNGYDAGLLTVSFKPNVVILDYLLPDINGNIVCRRIRERDDMAGTKIICVSGVVRDEEIKGLMRSGMDEFIKKPFDVDFLILRIATLAGLAAATRAG
ncbi:MAG: response regulator [Phycisphaeraceae bacterium]|nr:MAG: response regulator [Phycisphaeraceae bacterium]